ncbi:hypothetical protein M2158_005321 [Streptomyces sp. SAI-144]|nr:hypothetical protein [Streptomyces sp. SAI-144]
MHSSGRDEILGTAYSDHDLVVFVPWVGGPGPQGDPGEVSRRLELPAADALPDPGDPGLTYSVTLIDAWGKRARRRSLSMR